MAVLLASLAVEEDLNYECFDQAKLMPDLESVVTIKAI